MAGDGEVTLTFFVGSGILRRLAAGWTRENAGPQPGLATPPLAGQRG
jgi:hypothetical protein